MTNDPDYTLQLQALMQRVGLPSFRALSRKAGVSLWPVKQLRRGQALKMRADNLLKLSDALQVSLSELLADFGDVAPVGPTTGETPDLASVQQEYERLQAQMERQRESLIREFQQSSLEVLESWLLQWPTAAYAATQNSQVPAVRLLPLLRPVEQLVQEWGIEAIAAVGSEVPYDPQQHQLMDGMAQPGDPVKVRYTGYRQGDKLLYRAKVSPLQ